MTVFNFIEYEDNKLISSFFSYNMGDNAEDDSNHMHPRHRKKTNVKPSGSYSEVRRYHMYTAYNVSVLADNANERKEDATELLNLLQKRDYKVDYYYTSEDNSTIPFDLENPFKSFKLSGLTKRNESKIVAAEKPINVFPTNIYIGDILNDGLYLSLDEFETKYSRKAKKVENTTKDWGITSTKYTIKDNFFGDSEVIIYEKSIADHTVVLSHMSLDGIHWKNITDYLSSKSEFELNKDSYLEKKYSLAQKNSLPLPDKVAYINVLCSVETKIAVVSLNITVL